MPSPQRRDARASREALLDAFVALLAERGEDIPMYEIAKRAGVGQGTLYRHFPARTDLAAALFERVNDELEVTARASAGDPDLLDLLLRRIGSAQARLHSLSVALWSGESAQLQIAHLVERTRQLLDGPLRAAQSTGRVRADVTTDDLLSVTAMVEGVLMGITDPAARESAIDRALTLVWTGLGPRG